MSDSQQVQQELWETTHAPQILLLASRFTVPSVLTTLPFWNHHAAAHTQIRRQHMAEAREAATLDQSAIAYAATAQMQAGCFMTMAD